MEVEDFIQHNDVLNVIDQLRNHYREREFVISDVVDDKGHFYVDLVQEGGGVLGIALLGYTYVLEQMGIRFLSLGGTSAGAVNSVLLAAAGKHHEERTVKLIKILADQDLSDFVDGDQDVKRFIEEVEQYEQGRWWKIKALFKGYRVIDSLRSMRGLNPGINFHFWMKKELEQFGIESADDLQKHMADVSGLKFRVGLDERPELRGVSIGAKLAVVAAEVATESKIIFPEMASLFYEKSEKPLLSDFVRASMSIPLFFKPVTRRNLPNDAYVKRKWKRLTGYRGEIPKEAILVDGGIMSNFPVDVFHRIGLPTRPTFGVKLGFDRSKPHKINNIVDLTLNSFLASSNLRDYEFIENNPDYEQLVHSIDTKGHHWLDFDLSKDAKIDLFVRGAKAAGQFLRNFDWHHYLKIRQALLKDINPIDHKDIIHRIEDLIADKGQDIGTSEVLVLERRLYLLTEKLNGKILWIDDRPDNLRAEISILRRLGLLVTQVTESDEALSLIEESGDDLFDIIISDMHRGGNPRAGAEFVEEVFKLNETYQDKTLFYIKDLKKELGTPDYCFGITETCNELIQLILDILKGEE